jgi:hypothetical protein
VWKRIAGAITGKAVSFASAVVEPIDGKPVIPDDGTILVEAETPDEAYYIAGVLNSIIARLIIASYTYELRQETHIIDVIKVPKFDPNNDLHRRIAELSRRAHEVAKCIYAETKPDYCNNIRNPEKELEEIEKELDKAVAKLYDINEDALNDFRKLFAILSSEEVPDESEEEITPQEPSINVLNTTLKPNVKSSIEIDVVNPSGKEITFEYEMPWGKGSFTLVEGKYNIETPPLRPGKYEGVLKWTWNNETNTIRVTIEVSEPEGPKRRRTLLDV